MKLSALHESSLTDYRPLLRDVATECGLKASLFVDIDDTDDVVRDMHAGIDIFRLHQDTQGSAQVIDRLNHLSGVPVYKEDNYHDMIEALESYEGMPIAGLAEVHRGLDLLMKHSQQFKNSIKNVRLMFILLQAMMKMAHGQSPMQTKGMDHHESAVAYRASICKAALRKMGIPLELVLP